MKKLVCFSILAMISSLSWGNSELSCKKPVAINVTEGWKTQCVYNGSSLNQAYQTYRIITKNLGETPENLPTRNRKWVTSEGTEISITWLGKNRVFVSQVYTDSDSGVEVSFKKVGQRIQIEELGWTP